MSGFSQRSYQFLYQLFDDIFKDEILTRAAALAFYTTFSFSPLLVLIVVGLSLFDMQLQDDFINQVRGLMGQPSANLLTTVIAEAKSRPDLSSLSGWIGSLTLLFSASIVFSQIQSTLNQIFDVTSQRAQNDESWGKTIGNLIVDRLVSIGVLLAVVFVSIVSLVVSASIKWLVGTDAQWWSYLLSEATGFVIFTLVFTVLFQWMPDRKLHLSDTFFGAMVTALLFIVGKFAIGLYVGTSAIGSAYGAAGSLAILLVWVYYSSLILFFGAEIAWVFVKKRKRSENALAKMGSAA